MNRNLRYAFATVAAVMAGLSGLYGLKSEDFRLYSVTIFGIALVVWLFRRSFGISDRAFGIPRVQTRNLRALGYLSFAAAMGWAWLSSRYMEIGDWSVLITAVPSVFLVLLGFYFLVRDSLNDYKSRRDSS